MVAHNNHGLSLLIDTDEALIKDLPRWSLNQNLSFDHNFVGERGKDN